MVNTGSDMTLENPVKLKKHMNVYSLHKDTDSFILHCITVNSL